MSLTRKKGSSRGRKKSVRQFRISEVDKRARASGGRTPHASEASWSTKVIFGDGEPNSGEEAQEIYISSKTKERE